jgi:membrane protease YdiL (CAAX protease family)
MDNSNSRTRDLIALTFASLFPLAMALLYFVVLNKPGGDANPALMAAYSTGKTVQFLFPALYVWWFERSGIRFEWPTRRGMGIGAGFGLTVAAAMFALYFGVLQVVPVFATTTPEMIHDRLQQSKLNSPLAYAMMGLFLCVPHSLSEEYYWRWFVFGWLRRHVPMSVAVVLSGIGFMLHHVVILYVYIPGYFWTLALPFSLGVAVGGGFWAWLYQRSESLYAPWLSHAIVDTGIMTLGYVMLRGYWTPLAV